MFIASNYLSFNITLFGRFQDGAIPFASEGDRRLPAAKITLYIIFTSIVEKNTLLPFGTSVCTTIKLVFHSTPTRTFSRVVQSVSLFLWNAFCTNTRCCISFRTESFRIWCCEKVLSFDLDLDYVIDKL